MIGFGGVNEHLSIGSCDAERAHPLDGPVDSMHLSPPCPANAVEHDQLAERRFVALSISEWE
jgi:hypothetical protein